MKYLYIMAIIVVFAMFGLIVFISFSNPLFENKCSLVRIVGDKGEINPIYYEMMNEAENYIGGKAINSNNGVLAQQSESTFICVYSFTIQKGNIIEEVQVSHTFENNELKIWREE